MDRRVTVCLGVFLTLTACTATSRTATSHDSHPALVRPTVAPRAPTSGSAAARAHAPVSPGDRVLIRALYARVNRAFARGTAVGVRAIIASQYPGDRADVSFASCTSTIQQVVGASLPHPTRLTFVPDVATIVPDPTYVLSSGRVHSLHPKGRIYTTQISITQGKRTSVHKRHQVVLNNRAYQFSAC